MESAPEVPSITKAQLTKLAILIRELGMERDESLALFSGWIDRDIQSTKELTVPEASAVIDRLEDAKAAAADPATGEVVAEDLQPEVW